MSAVHVIRSGQVPTSFSPLAPFFCAWQERTLIVRLVRREVEARYRGSILGLAWAVLVPLLMLAVYTFVFSVVFQARWDTPVSSRAEFSMLLFSGLIAFNFFAECLNRAPGLMLENISYIKKVVFPLEIMPWVAVGVSLVNALIGFVVLLILFLFVRGLPPLSALWLPFIFLPLLMVTFGVTCVISSMGVFVRDIRQFIGVLTTILMFLSPVFYPISAVPARLQKLLYLNPLTLLLETSKDLLFWGRAPDSQRLALLGIYLVLAWLTSWLGYVWLVKTKKGFADVL